MTRTMKTKPISLDALSIDNRINRPINNTWVAKTADHFDPSLIGVLVVSKRTDGSLVIVDGQHRYLVMRRVGWNGHRVVCAVIEGLTLQDEAKLFRGLNNARKPSYIDAYFVRLTERDPVALALERIIDAAGYVPSRNSRKEGGLYAVQTCERIYRGFYLPKTFDSDPSQTFPDYLEATLHVVTAAWGHRLSSVQGALLEGVARLFFRHGLKATDKDHLTRRMAKYPGHGDGLIGAARGRRNILGGSLGNNVAAVLTEEYNRGRRGKNRLPEWRN